MSAKIVAEVWQYAQVKDTELLLLLALADYADSVRAECYPSVARLAGLIRRTSRQTKRLLHKLEADGHIQIRYKAAPRGTNTYTILRPWHGVTFDVTAHMGNGDSNGTFRGDIQMSPDPNSHPNPGEKDSACAHEEGEKPQVTNVTEAKVSAYLTPGSDPWYFAQGLTPPGEDEEASLQGNGHHKGGMALANGVPCRL